MKLISLKYIAITSISLFLAFYSHMTNLRDSIKSSSNWASFVQQIIDSDPLPSQYYTITDEYFLNYTTKSFWAGLLDENYLYSSSPCTQVSYNYFYSNDFEQILLPFLVGWAITMELEKAAGPNKCYDFLLNEEEYGNNVRGVKNAARYYFDKELSELSKIEIIKLNLLPSAPQRLNPLIYPGRLDSLANKVLGKEVIF